MNRLVGTIAAEVRGVVVSKVMALSSPSAELRIVFHGPPGELLKPVFEELAKGGGITVEAADGKSIVVPVLLHSEEAGECPRVGQSGVCSGVDLNNLRNQPTCPKFVALVEPGNHPSLALTIESSSESFGLSAHSNSGNASIEEWWEDVFIRDLVDKGLKRLALIGESEIGQARKMIYAAVRDADEALNHKGSRAGAWRILSRVYTIPNTVRVCPHLSLCCGFPPTEDCEFATEDQIEVLKEVAEHLVEHGITKGIAILKEDAQPVDMTALDSFAEFFQQRAQTATDFPRAMSAFYSPDRHAEPGSPPDWYLHLTLERWRDLLAEDSQPEGSLSVVCKNEIFPPVRGCCSVVQEAVELELGAPESAVGSIDARLTRRMAPAKNTTTTQISVNRHAEYRDNELPVHKKHTTYVLEAQGFKSSSLKVIALKSFEPGFFVNCRNAKKVKPPRVPSNKRSGVDYECIIELEGSGRHYIDIYTREATEFGSAAKPFDDSDSVSGLGNAQVSKIDDVTWGFEAEVGGETHYDLDVQVDGGEWQTVRVFLTSGDQSPEGCKSEFERLIRINRHQEKGRAMTDVQLDRNIRCSDLQTWVLDAENISKSYYPLVISTDYATVWRPRNWESSSSTVISQGKFMNDPRPPMDEFAPPQAFLEARTRLGEILRGSDENGLIEASPLGQTLVGDEAFGTVLFNYLSSYLQWLEASPDVAPWVDVVAFCSFEQDRTTLKQEPDAIIVNPLHPLRLVWQAVAQKALFFSIHKHRPCPAAGILDPSIVPDIINLPLLLASGAKHFQSYLAVESSSDYWGVLWNGKRLDGMASSFDKPPFDAQFGIRIGGIASGFSLAQVRRALDDVSEIFAAKPMITVRVSSCNGQTSACNEGIADWCKSRLGFAEDREDVAMGPRLLQILDLRDEGSRPEDAEISNLAEDTANAVRWFAGEQGISSPDLAIIAQLETANPREDAADVGTPLGWGALIRHRVRRQLRAGAGAFISESRAGVQRPPSGDALADRIVATTVKLENLDTAKIGFSFAPSVRAITDALEVAKAEFVAISSSAVDPACFFGDWLSGHLWDFDLPSYSHKSGDVNGYYLVSRVKETDRDILKRTLRKLPGGESITDEQIKEILLEVCRRGIPTLRGLSSGNAGAAGDLGLLLASRLLQDSFRVGSDHQSLLPILTESGDVTLISLVIPVDPFRAYLDDLRRALKAPQLLRPDLIVAVIRLRPSGCELKLTPVEVKYRSDTLSLQECKDALDQAASLGKLFKLLQEVAGDPDLVMWRLTFQHLIVSMLGFALRVYSQQKLAANQSKQWTEIHAAVVTAILSEEIRMDVDPRGRLVVFDASPTSSPRDVDEDGFSETLVISPQDASNILTSENPDIYGPVKARLLFWDFLPQGNESVAVVAPAPPSTVDKEAATPEDHEKQPLPPKQPPPVSVEKTVQPDQTTQVGGDSEMSEGQSPTRFGSANASGISFVVGETTDGFRAEARIFQPSNTNLNQLNVGVVGDLGTGKTQLLKAFIYQMTRSADANRGVRPRFLIFDYKKDYTEEKFVTAVGAKVVLPHHVPVNVFDIRNSKTSLTPWLDRFNFFSDVLDKIYSGIGPVQRKQLKNAVKSAYEACKVDARQPTVYDVASHYSKIIGSKADSPSAILEDIVDREMFHPEPEKAEAFEEFLDGVVVVDLASLGQDDRAKNMLVAVMLNMFYEHMLRIPKRPYQGTAPQLRVVDSFLLVDEADNIMRYEFDVLRKVLLQGREFGVGVILASQYLRHFKAGASDYREPLLTWFIHKVPNIVPSELQALGLSADVAQMAERIKELPKHSCLYKTLDVAGDIITGTPFYTLLDGKS